MAVPYNHLEVEEKWTKKWEENPININDGKKPKYYCLDMFPYPSGAGLHVGHWRGYVISDVWARYKMMDGNHYVIHPMGWDAFGLPAENYAIKTGQHPAISTANNIRNIKRQIKQIGAIRDWDMELNTTDPSFYKWTQWIFVQMFKHGLAYEKKMPLNWCPHCKAVLANEEVVDGKCERCGTEVTKKNLRQWMLRITKYADRLLDGLDTLDWPDKVKKMQRDWIGRSYGAEVDFPVDGRDEKITVYTTRPDTLWGATFMVLSPEHELAKKIATPEQAQAVDDYCKYAANKSNVERVQNKEKTGVFTGAYAVNPLNGKKIPIWLSDYVLADYGTGAIMCVPAHDDRDFAFAKKFGLPIIQVIAKDGKEIKDMKEAYTEASGTMINSGDWNGMESSKLKKEAPFLIEKMGIGRKTVNYKLRDWVFSRQRYWGEPIPIVHCPKCGAVPVPEEQLPVLLPDVESYQPTDTGESPLAAIDSWVNTTCPCCGGPAKRETNTMPQWAGSSWYFLRYVDVHNDKELVSREKADKYLPVDMYIGGVEHAVLHLLYSRFYTKFLHDIGVIDFDEPFQRLFNQGMILGPKGIKMSKSLGNVVSPDDMVRDYGCDSLRLYELFIGPPEQDSAWDERGIDGVSRFLKKFWNLALDSIDADVKATPEMIKLRHKLIQDITMRLNQFALNTAVSKFMEYNNQMQKIAQKEGGIDKETIGTYVSLLAPFAPHISEEIWERLGHTDSVFHQEWPKADAKLAADDEKDIPVQIMGKTKAVIRLSVKASKDEALSAGKAAVADKIGDAAIVKEIYVPGRIINFVIRK
ncbi:MAG: leucine--tRNA ligase [Lachnospiraceae bacterium]|jgi:leucyl-tRNA synthetase|nr:leucine--tRNA ligase [Lachnospiraceae bacterium]MCH4064652.1 leucine--tRNA ligase [Lachnospiraceae bacterium]MCH4104884.1 leucine--tRNA ligase [Lachnospiraceae bacterium]MCI1309732.1 leucine--tRNA ligase [Lachnospiraceae bacterium]MCI1334119.1 leucine--tRNA ligase [Lachnospiraceae bacterium]